MKNNYYIVAGLILLVMAWGFGFAHGKEYWKERYEWINDNLRTDIQNCRDTLNQCKLDLDNPEHCLSVCVAEWEKFGC